MVRAARQCPLRLLMHLRTRYHPGMIRLRRLMPVLLLLSFVLGAVQAVAGRGWPERSAGTVALPWTACLPDGCDSGSGGEADAGNLPVVTCLHGGGCVVLPVSPAGAAFPAQVAERYRPVSPILAAGRDLAPDQRPPIASMAV